MKLIHLSDLHIGKRVNEISMLEEQQHILSSILLIIDAEKPDAVLIAGDVYDKSIPSTEAVSLFDDFLVSLARRNVPVMIISGNHDSAERLAFCNRLLGNAGIHISPAYHGPIEPVTLSDDVGDVNFWLLPFVKPAHVKRFHPEAHIDSYTDACRVAIENMAIDFSKRNVLLTHQFVTGAATCSSEEISVGGTDNVDASVFDCFDYVALGHIHGPQNIGSNRIRYCGTPLKYSISEESHHKSITIVHLGQKGELLLELRPLTPLHDMRTIRGNFETLTSKTFYAETATEDYLQIILTDEEDIPEAMGRLRQIYPNIMSIHYDNSRTRANQVIDGALEVQRKSPLELFGELYELQNNRPMSDEQHTYLQKMIESIWEANQ